MRRPAAPLVFRRSPGGVRGRPEWRLGELAYQALVGIALLATGCATEGTSSAPRALRGVSGPVEWEIRDIGRLVSLDGQRMRWSFAILLREATGSTIQFERVERGSYAPGMEIIGGTAESRPFVRTLTPNSEMSYPVPESWGWDRSHATRHAFGGAGTISPLTVEYRFAGKDSAGGAVTVLARIRLDRSVGRAVTPRPTTGPLPPMKNLDAADLPSLAGAWAGSYRADRGDFDVPIEVVIRPDGSFEVGENDPVTNRFRATVRIRDGKLAYTHGSDSGDLTLYEGDGKRVLSGHVSGPRKSAVGAPPTQSGYIVRIEWRSP